MIALTTENTDLNINTDGGVITIQNVQPLGIFTLAGLAQLNANITTQGSQTYTDNVVLNPSTGTVNLISLGQNIIFEQPIDSATTQNADLNINAVNGNIEAQNDIGNNTPIAELNINANNITLQNVTSINDQNYTNNGLNHSPARANTIPDKSTIYKTAPGDVNFFAENFIMGNNEKLTVANGNLTINVGNGQALICDLNAAVSSPSPAIPPSTIKPYLPHS